VQAQAQVRTIAMMAMMKIVEGVVEVVVVVVVVVENKPIAVVKKTTQVISHRHNTSITYITHVAPVTSPTTGETLSASKSASTPSSALALIHTYILLKNDYTQRVKQQHTFT
jgi:hypothetical protein